MGKKDTKIKEEEQEFIEIQDGEMYLKIPKNMNMTKVINILAVFNEPELEPEPTEEEIKKVEDEISVTAEPQVHEAMTHCPKCHAKLKSKVKKRGNELIRIVRCKKSKGFRKKCDFVHEFSIKI